MSGSRASPSPRSVGRSGPGLQPRESPGCAKEQVEPQVGLWSNTLRQVESDQPVQERQAQAGTYERIGREGIADVDEHNGGNEAGAHERQIELRRPQFARNARAIVVTSYSLRTAETNGELLEAIPAGQGCPRLKPAATTQDGERYTDARPGTDTRSRCARKDFDTRIDLDEPQTVLLTQHRMEEAAIGDRRIRRERPVPPDTGNG